MKERSCVNNNSHVTTSATLAVKQAEVDDFVPDSTQVRLLEGLRNLPFNWSSHHTTYWQHGDHLGSASWITDTLGKGIQYLHYLPWGEELVNQRCSSFESRFTFSGKELDRETGYNYFGARLYHSAASLWLSVDPLSDKYPAVSPYAYCGNNPVRLVDKDGREIEVTQNDNGTYTVTGGILNKNRNIYVVKDGKRTGTILGQTLTDYSFFNDEGNVVKGAIIDVSDNSGQKFIDGFIEHTPDLHTYVFDKEKGGQTGGDCDFKNRSIPYGLSQVQKDIYHNRGMVITINGTSQIASARDIGNYAAGYIAGATGIPKLLTRIAFDVYQRGFEPQVTKAAENLGYARGKMTYIRNHPQHWK